MSENIILDICESSGCYKKIVEHEKNNLHPLKGIAVKLISPEGDLEALFTLPNGCSYMEIYRRIYRGTGKFPDTFGECTEGYYTSSGVFVDKEKALEIAKNLMLVDFDKKDLFPEDIFTNK